MRKIYPVAKGIDLKVFIASCLDRRYRVARRLFIEQELGFTPENIVPVKRAGGAGPLRKGKRGWKSIPKDLRKQTDLFMKRHPEIDTVVLMNHEDCRRFDKLRKKNRKQKLELLHLKRAVKIFARRYPGKKILGYFGCFLDKTQQEIYFKLVAKS